jgi:hypothetical protein
VGTTPTSRGRRAITGYYLLAADGHVLAFGAAAPIGADLDVGGRRCVAITSFAEGGGVVVATADGALLAPPPSPLGGASSPTAASIVDAEGTPYGTGLWVLDAAGGVFCHGDALFHGSIPGLDLGAQIEAVAIASTPTGLGYWILDVAGGVYCFGDAAFHGSVPALHLEEPPAPAVDLAATATGDGYAVLAADGTIRAFGDARADLCKPLAAARPVAVGAGSDAGALLVADERGLIYPLGTAPMYGSAAGRLLDAPIVDMVLTRSPDG